MDFIVLIFAKLAPFLRIFTQYGQEVCKWGLYIYPPVSKV